MFIDLKPIPALSISASIPERFFIPWLLMLLGVRADFCFHNDGLLVFSYNRKIGAMTILTGDLIVKEVLLRNLQITRKLYEPLFKLSIMLENESQCGHGKFFRTNPSKFALTVGFTGITASLK